MQKPRTNVNTFQLLSDHNRIKIHCVSNNIFFVSLESEFPAVFGPIWLSDTMWKYRKNKRNK